MSGSEDKQNNRMSAEDIEAEEMAQELMNMEMYEEGMEYEQMKQILRVINESRNMAGIEPENTSVQEVVRYSPELIAPIVSSKNSSSPNLIPGVITYPKTSFSYRTQESRVSPKTSNRRSSLDLSPPEEMSVSSPEMFTDKETVQSATTSDSLFSKLLRENKATYDRDDNEPEATVKNTRHIFSDNSQTSRDIEADVDVKSRKNQRVERWKLDPTDAVIDENDIPLLQKSRPILHERVPYSFCHHRRALEASEKVLTVLSHHLDEVAEIWRGKHRTDVSEFQWGSPIKVGANNGSLDKKPPVEDADQHEESENMRRSQNRNCKRKANKRLKTIIQNQFDSDDDSDDIFENPKKSKSSDSPWLTRIRPNTNTSESHQTRQDKIFNNLNSGTVEKSTLFEDVDSDEFDNDDLATLRKRSKKKDANQDPTYSPQSSEVYPRRIVPPNPNKRKPIRRQQKNGDKDNKKSPARKTTQAVLEDFTAKNKLINPLSRRAKSQTTLVLKDNELIDKEVEIEEKDAEIKPLALGGLACKLYQGSSLLLQSKKAEQIAEKAKSQQLSKLQEIEKQQKQELVATRMRAEEKERKRKNLRESEIKANEEKWKSNEASRNRDRRQRQLQEKRNLNEKSDAELLIVESDKDDTVDGINTKPSLLKNLVQCPICHVRFSKEDVQAHAAECDKFDDLEEPAGPSGPSSNDDDNDIVITEDCAEFMCYTCCMFKTRNGIAYEDHVHNCLRRKRNAMISPSEVDTPGMVVVEVPSSPIRCFETISEQTDSTIKYAEQFPKLKKRNF